jgi:hypothetical protein
MERQIGNPSEHSRVANPPRSSPSARPLPFARASTLSARARKLGALRRCEGRDDDALRANAMALPQSSL